MKDHGMLALESTRPRQSPMECVQFCLEQLYKCERHRITDEVATRLTYEELIGALLHARDVIEEHQDCN